jgi:sulfate adenylyltransferase
MVATTLDVAERAQLDQVLIGLLPGSALAGADGDVYLDEDGTPLARRDAGGLVAIGAPRWPHPDEIASDAPVVVAVDGALPAGPLPPGSLLLLPSAGVRPDDTRHAAWATAWSSAALAGASPAARPSVVPIPVAPADSAPRADQLAASYSSGPRLEVDTEPQPRGAGRTAFMTGLSGSGKSTIARALVERLAGERSITLLDGDVVRTHLSRGLGFSREDRDLNIRRIGWVAGEVTKHGGLAVCAPIAPYEQTRQWVRETVDGAGGPGSFVLIWISTPIEECERRDVKGLYAKARAGEITGFTGIDDPYEAPVGADLEIDTTTVSVAAAVDRIVGMLDR